MKFFPRSRSFFTKEEQGKNGAPRQKRKEGKRRRGKSKQENKGKKYNALLRLQTALQVQTTVARMAVLFGGGGKERQR